ncbi:hypothetical protein CHS0354_038209 [Potamilus streckersoni]|uniref:Uncharacterized protein n=1 Tax=Potamilus streckersoni TaxID=2493646 RepID=A0AAE0W4E0_9BIVA|nr:hypothetical protein CHS0354_038209 [Potamilus streckersoni]
MTTPVPTTTRILTPNSPKYFNNTLPKTNTSSNRSDQQRRRRIHQMKTLNNQQRRRNKNNEYHYLKPHNSIFTRNKEQTKTKNPPRPIQKLNKQTSRKHLLNYGTRAQQTVKYQLY